MHGAKLGTIVLAGLVALGGACSLAGLDDYANGMGVGASGGGGGVTTGTGGTQTTSTTSTSTSTSSTTSTTTPPCNDDVCGGECVDLNSDAKNCGACGLACWTGYQCNGGVCENAVVDVSTNLVTCAVLDKGEVWCWGQNGWGEAGIQPSAADTTCAYDNIKCQSKPVRIPGIVNAVEVATGTEAVCARTKGGDVYCWGSNLRGLLGHDPIDPLCIKGGPGNGQPGPCTSTPAKVDFPAGVVPAQLVMGGVTACVRTTTKDVYCWGSNRNGEVQAPAGGYVYTPTKNANVDHNAEDLAISVDMDTEYSTVCYRESGSDRVQCWGQSVDRTLFVTGNAGGCSKAYCNPNAKVVYENFAALTTPVLADRVQVGWLVGCVLRQGRVKCWGDNNYGQSGTGQMGPQKHFDPLVLDGIPDAQAISSRHLTTLVLDKAGSVWALGWADEGQIGNGSFGLATCPNANGQKCVNTATHIEALEKVVKIVSGPHNSAAITSDGKLWMWGSNYTAALGHKPFTNGDVSCLGSANAACNAMPAVVTGMP